MKKINIFVCMFAILWGLSSCTDWLTIQPKTETSKDDMFKTEGGFHDALVGSYILLRNNYEPDANMLMSLDCMANLWFAPSNSSMGDLANHNYRNDDVERALGNIFLNQYQVITNLNLLLSYVDNGVLSSENYALNKGEALALRAFLHFDLIRLWGPIPTTVNEGYRYLPYATRVTLDNYEYSTYSSYTRSLIADLDSAEVLLKRVDPILKYSNTTLNTTSQYRQNHMNYYAVLALKARVHLWMGNKTEALRYARMVVEAKDPSGALQFKLGGDSDITLRDRVLYNNEQVFGLHIEDFDDAMMAAGYYASLYQFTTYINELFGISTDDNGSDRYSDLRGKIWYASTYRSGATTYCRSTRKYDGMSSLDAAGNSAAQAACVPLIRLSEMYLIMMECTELGEANSLYNDFLGRWDLQPVELTANNRASLLETEYLKEFFAEGQMFYYYKRLNTYR